MTPKQEKCGNCLKVVDERACIFAWFGWQQDNDAECRNCIDLAEMRKNNKCEHCLNNPDPFCEHSEKEDSDDDEDLGYFELPWAGTKSFCSYECLEKCAKGEISWYERDACFSVTTNSSFETRFFCNAKCDKCFIEDEQEWIIVYIDDPMCQNLNYRPSTMNNKKMRHC